LQRWAPAGGFKKGAKPASLDLGNMPKQQVANMLYRFFDWWIDGKPGDPVQGGLRVSARDACDATTVCMHPCVFLDRHGSVHDG
jgi:hypothetical protein